MTMTLMTGGLVGGLILFVWSAISWMAIPWHHFEKFTDEDAVLRVIKENAPRSGVYGLPAHHVEPRATPEQRKTAEEKATELLKTGPLTLAAIRVEGMSTIKPNLIIAFVSQVAAACLVTWLTMQTGVSSYVGRVAVVLVFASAAAIVCYVPYWNWHGFSAGYTVVQCADLLIGWFFAGLAIARLATPIPTT